MNVLPENETPQHTGRKSSEVLAAMSLHLLKIDFSYGKCYHTYK